MSQIVTSSGFGDRRRTPFSGRVAHVSLRGQIDARFTDGALAQVVVPVADLLAAPGGARDRQLLLGEAVLVIDHDAGHAFVQAAKDGYCGWLRADAVGQGAVPTHWVASPATHVYPEPRVQSHERMALSLGARLAVIGNSGDWAQTGVGFVPALHLRAIGDWAKDPVAVAESLLGTPYLWGGNSRAGLDCSGLVQLALSAAGLDCPGDGDQQLSLGRPLEAAEALRRGDLVFWQGHVALVAAARQLIHANGQAMAVVYEATDACVARIKAQGGGAVIAHRRLAVA